MRFELFFAITSAPLALAIQLMEVDDMDDVVPEACQDALVADVDCDVELTLSTDPSTTIQNIFAFPGDVFEALCSEECHQSLNKYVDGVRTQCSNTEKYPILGLSIIPLEIAGIQLWIHNMMCIKDSAGFCMKQGLEVIRGCNDCHYQFAANAQSFELGQKFYDEEDYQELIESCGVEEPSVTTISISPVPLETTAPATEATMITADVTSISSTGTENSVTTIVPAATGDATGSELTQEPENNAINSIGLSVSLFSMIGVAIGFLIL